MFLSQVSEASNMHYMTNRHARNEACKAPGKCLNPYCSLYDCYERNNKPLCAGEIKNVVNTPTEAKVREYSTTTMLSHMSLRRDPT